MAGSINIQPEGAFNKSKVPAASVVVVVVVAAAVVVVVVVCCSRQCQLVVVSVDSRSDIDSMVSVTATQGWPG